MSGRATRIAGLMAGALLFVTGCSSGWHRPGAEGTFRSHISTNGPRGEVRVVDASVSNKGRVEAHARYAAGVVNDLRAQPEAADQEFLKAVEADRDNETLAIELALRFLQRKQADRSADLLKAVSVRPEASGAVFVWLGLAELQRGNTNEAVIAYREATRRAPDALLAYLSLAQISFESGRPDEALGLVDEATSRSATEPEHLVGLAELLVAYRRSGSLVPEQANPRILTLLGAAGKLEPSEPTLLQRMGLIYQSVGELGRATALYRDLLAQHAPTRPAMAAVWREQLVQLYFLAGQRAEAVEQLKEIQKATPTNPKVHFLLGTLAMEKREYAEAAACFERTLLLDDDFEPAYYDLAVTRLSLGLPDQALAALTEARRRFQPGFVMEFYRGVALSARKDYTAAREALGAAELFAKADDPARLNHVFYFQAGAVAERLARYEEAEGYFRRCLELDPENAEALNYLGYMFAERGVKLDEALQLVTKALEFEPANGSFLDSLAWVQFRQGRHEEALVSMRKAIEQTEKPDPTLFDHLGDILNALGRRAEAEKAWRQALELEPSEAVRGKLDATAKP